MKVGGVETEDQVTQSQMRTKLWDGASLDVMAGAGAG